MKKRVQNIIFSKVVSLVFFSIKRGRFVCLLKVLAKEQRRMHFVALKSTHKYWGVLIEHSSELIVTSKITGRVLQGKYRFYPEPVLGSSFKLCNSIK
jgi:hypothetical protein